MLDRFHIVANLQKAVNEIRAAEARKMKGEGYEERAQTHQVLFPEESGKTSPTTSASSSRTSSNTTSKASAPTCSRKAFQQFWSYRSPRWAEWYLKKVVRPRRAFETPADHEVRRDDPQTPAF